MKTAIEITYTGRHWIGEMYDDDFRGDTAEDAIVHAAKLLSSDGVKASKVSVRVPVGRTLEGLPRVRRFTLWTSEEGLR